MNEPILRLMKNAERTTNKITLPKVAVEKFGKQFYMEIYEDKIVLIPIKKGS